LLIQKSKMISTFIQDRKDMQTVTVEINSKNALKALENLEEKHFIRIIEKTEISSPSLPGKPLGITEFKQWIASAEAAPAISLQEAKTKWASKRKQLHKLTK
jgi:hypothetical protein